MILGWLVVWAGVELKMFSEWAIVIGLSLLARAFVSIDKIVQLARGRRVEEARSR